MRPISIVIVLLLILVAIGTFLMYGGQRAGSINPAEPKWQRVPVDGNTPATPDLRAEIEALSKRVEALADEIARLRQGNDRAPVGAAQTSSPAEDFVPAHRDAILRLIAEDRDRLAVEQKVTAMRLALVEFVATEESGFSRKVAKDRWVMDFPSEDVTNLLVDARLRYGEICRRVVPLGHEPEGTGPWKARFDDEVARLREWRRAELIRLVGAPAADACANEARRVLGF